MNEHTDLDEFTSDEDMEPLKRVCSLVDQVTNNVRGTVNDITRTDLTLEPLVNLSNEINNKVDSLIPVILESGNEYKRWIDELQSAKIQHEKDQDEIKDLKILQLKEENEIKDLKIQQQKDQDEINDLKIQMRIHSDYCSNVGAVLGILVWRASLTSKMVNIWLSEPKSFEKLKGMLTIVDRVVESFFETYQNVLPRNNTDEFTFLMGLLGTISNISAISKGRQFLIDTTDGKNLIKNLVKYFPLIPTDSGDSLKKLIVTILCNMCVNEDGLRYLIKTQIGQVVLHCLGEQTAENNQIFGLRLLQSITLDLTEPELLNDLLKFISIETIRRIANSEGDDKISKFARKVLEYLKNFNKIDITQEKDF